MKEWGIILLCIIAFSVGYNYVDKDTSETLETDKKTERIIAKQKTREEKERKTCEVCGCYDDDVKNFPEATKFLRNKYMCPDCIEIYEKRQKIKQNEEEKEQDKEDLIKDKQKIQEQYNNLKKENEQLLNEKQQLKETINELNNKKDELQNENKTLKEYKQQETNDGTNNTNSNEENIVYWTPYGHSYHTTTSCPTLSRSETIYSGTINKCPNSDPCNRCQYKNYTLQDFDQINQCY